MTRIKAISELIITEAQEKKATDIRVYDLEGQSSVTDLIILVSVSNKIHCKSLLQVLEAAVVSNLQQDPSDDFYEAPRLSGNPDSGWVVLDFNAIIVHVLTEDIRLYYELDNLYVERATVHYH